MATHDYVIANGTGAAVRSDLNDALAAIVSNNSGSSEPATTYAYQWWADTTANVLKIRNSANNAWITLRELDGTMLIEDGSNSAPGLAFAADTNTGIFRPADDQIGFATAGVQRLVIETGEVVFNDPSNDVDFRVESNGNTHMLFVDAGNDRVGIGTSSPSSKLHLSGGAENVLLETTNSSGNAFFGIRNGSYGLLGTGDAYIYKSGGDIALLADGASDVIKFATGGNTERARIDSSGRLLVGTSSNRSDSALQLEGTTFATSRLSLTQNSADANSGATLKLSKSKGTSNGSFTAVSSGNRLGNVLFTGADGSGDITAATIEAFVDATPGTNDMPGRLVFSTTANGASSTTERMRIDSSGRLGIGTTSPSGGQLVVNSTLDASNKQLVLRDATNGWTRKIGLDSSNNLNFYDGDTERMRIDSSGRLLVGTSSSMSSLSDVKIEAVSAAGGEIHLGRNDTSVTVGNSIGNLRFYGNDSNGTYQECARIAVQADGTHQTDDKSTRLAFSVTAGGASSPTERLRIDNSGLVGIGTASAAQVLQVHKAASSPSYVHITNNVSGSASGDGTLVGLSSTAEAIIWNQENTKLRFAMNNTERMRLDSGGIFKVTDDGSSSEYFNASFNSHLIHSSYTNSEALLLEHSSSTDPFGITIDFTNDDPDDNSNYFLNCKDSTTNRLIIYSDGDVQNHDNSYGSLSDQKLKQDIVDAGSQWDDIKDLRVRKFKFKSDVAAYGDDAKTLIGLVAQEAELVSPGLVKDDPDLDNEQNDLGTVTKSIRYSVLYMKAVKALQEAMDRIETLEAKVAALEAG